MMVITRSKNNNKSSNIKPKRSLVGEDNTEDYCYICKNGGHLIVCDHKDCVKAYHAKCLKNKGHSVGLGDDNWICGWHSCFKEECDKISIFQCICCPTAVCDCCINDAPFAPIKGNKGLCVKCLELALLIEKSPDVDSDKEEVDFRDLESHEGFLFADYWGIIKNTEELTLEDLQSAESQLKGKTYESQSCKSYFKSCEGRLQKGKRHKASTRTEFEHWASESLIEFLKSIGKDTSEKQSQDEVASIISNYALENKLVHLENKKKIVLCDEPLLSLLGRRKVNINIIRDLIEAHFPENLVPEDAEDSDSEEEAQDPCPLNDNENILLSSQKRKRSAVDSISQKGLLAGELQLREREGGNYSKEDSAADVSASPFASVTPSNIRLVYLRRSLVEELLKLPETFQSKVVGSFVRVMSDTSDRKKSHQLLQVTGINKSLLYETKMEVRLQLSNLPDAIPIHMLSNDDFSEEECKVLHQKVKDGLIERPTVVELEKKARFLHEDITKHSIARELAFIKTRIDLANERGWRTKLDEYLQRRKLLQSSGEQSRLLQVIPKVTACKIVPKHTSEGST